MSVILVLDDFDTVSSTLEVHLCLDGGSMLGSWHKLKDTLGGDPGFPDSGSYRADAGGVDLQYDDAGAGEKDVILCQLVGMAPGKTTEKTGLVANFGERLMKYTTANWNQDPGDTDCNAPMP